MIEGINDLRQEQTKIIWGYDDTTVVPPLNGINHIDNPISLAIIGNSIIVVSDYVRRMIFQFSVTTGLLLASTSYTEGTTNPVYVSNNVAGFKIKAVPPSIAGFTGVQANNLLVGVAGSNATLQVAVSVPPSNENQQQAIIVSTTGSSQLKGNVLSIVNQKRLLFINNDLTTNDVITNALALAAQNLGVSNLAPNNCSFFEDASILGVVYADVISGATTVVVYNIASPTAPIIAASISDPSFTSASSVTWYYVKKNSIDDLQLLVTTKYQTIQTYAYRKGTLSLLRGRDILAAPEAPTCNSPTCNTLITKSLTDIATMYYAQGGMVFYYTSSPTPVTLPPTASTQMLFPKAECNCPPCKCVCCN
ncbi:MAG: hypothetical protein Harvfovirus3_58 [Harvfovirus sp.]|uniref:Uncharacterized protein n=1 Tax=Harvfovirus sp. TaxID=2487768 RepID=A0A3G5A463_9VIRU|nr:MAG: hypothetical protein Harvfovirus3_58 [Harvfovirus sp.]